MNRLFVLLLIAAVGGSALSVGHATAQSTFPTKAVQLIVPFPPGASTDLLARFLAPKLQDALGQTVVVENRAGAGGLIGASVVAKSTPDGHTLLVASSTVMQGPLLQKKPAFETLTSFAPVAAAFQHPFLLAASATIPVQNIGELIRYAKDHPGRLNAASLGGFSDVMSMMFRRGANVDIQIVPYRGGAEAMIGVVRGDSHLVFNPYSAMEAQLTSGQLRPMAVTSLKRSAATPNVPTLDESGLKDFEIINVVGVLAPAGTPEPIVKRLSEEVAKIMRSEEGRQFVLTRGNDLVPDYSPAFYARQLSEADKRFRDVVDEIGFQKQ